MGLNPDISQKYKRATSKKVLSTQSSAYELVVVQLLKTEDTHTFLHFAGIVFNYRPIIP
jgi:hypothetical protein